MGGDPRHDPGDVTQAFRASQPSAVGGQQDLSIMKQILYLRLWIGLAIVGVVLIPLTYMVGPGHSVAFAVIWWIYVGISISAVFSLRRKLNGN